MKWFIWFISYAIVTIISNCFVHIYLVKYNIPSTIWLLIYVLVALSWMIFFFKLIEIIYKVTIISKATESGRLKEKRKWTKYENENYVKEATKKERRDGLEKIRLDPKVGYVLNDKPIKGGVILESYTHSFWIKKLCRIHSVKKQEHSLIVGSPGSGKSYCFILPMICNIALAKENIITNDPKGELHLGTLNFLLENDYNVNVLDFINPEYSQHWNPFYLCVDAYQQERKRVKEKIKIAEENKILYNHDYDKNQYEYRPNYSKSLEYLRDVVDAFLANVKDDAIWKEGALKLIEGVALLLLEKEMDEYVNLKNIIYIVNTEQDGKKSYLKELMKDASPAVINRLNMYVSSSEKTKQSFMASFNSYLSKYEINEDIMSITSESTIDIRKFATESKQALFLKVHDNKTTYHNFASLFYKQCYDVLIEESKKSKKYFQTGVDCLDTVVHFVLDEFGVMPPIAAIDTVYAAARGRDIRYHVALQGFDQIVKHYGKEIANTITSSITHLVYLKSGDQDTHFKLSKFFGNTLIWNKNKNDYEEKPMYTPEKLSKYKQGYAFVKSQGKNPYNIKFLGYRDFPFYRPPASASTLDKIPLQDVKLFNIKEFLLQ